MSLKGNASASQLLRGKINRIDVIHTDTYQIAVANGYKGTVDEWLESLVGEKGNSVLYHNGSPKGKITMLQEASFNFPPKVGDFAITGNYRLFLVKSVRDGYAIVTDLGSISADLSNYYTKDELDAGIEELLKGLVSTNLLSEELAVRDERIASVEASIGDIYTALTDLHNYAEALKGGGVV